MERCSGKIEVPTLTEREALTAMRAIKARVREAKAQLSSLANEKGAGPSKEILDLETELASLKTQWNRWEEKRRKAAEERMVLLGHES
jgi:chromosome segregation ATPase